jgi:hypothetical protein
MTQFVCCAITCGNSVTFQNSRLHHARLVAWVSDATNSSVSLESTAAKLGTRTCRPLQTKFLQLYLFTFSEVSLDSTAKLGTTDRSSIIRIQASDWCKRVAYGYINPGVLPIFLIVKFGNLVPIHSLLRYYSHSIVRVHAPWSVIQW